MGVRTGSGIGRGTSDVFLFRHLAAFFQRAGAAAAVWHTRVVERCVGRLLVVAVADPSERVRKEVLRALVATTALDDYLAQVRGGGGGGRGYIHD